METKKVHKNNISLFKLDFGKNKFKFSMLKYTIKA